MHAHVWARWCCALPRIHSLGRMHPPCLGPRLSSLQAYVFAAPEVKQKVNAELASWWPSASAAHSPVLLAWAAVLCLIRRSGAGGSGRLLWVVVCKGVTRQDEVSTHRGLQLEAVSFVGHKQLRPATEMPTLVSPHCRRRAQRHNRRVGAACQGGARNGRAGHAVPAHHPRRPAAQRGRDVQQHCAQVGRLLDADGLLPTPCCHASPVASLTFATNLGNCTHLLPSTVATLCCSTMSAAFAAFNLSPAALPLPQLELVARILANLFR